MKTQIRTMLELTIVFLTMEDNKVYVTYFKNCQEVTSWEELNDDDSIILNGMSDLFFQQNPELIKYSY